MSYLTCLTLNQETTEDYKNIQFQIQMYFLSLFIQFIIYIFFHTKSLYLCGIVTARPDLVFSLCGEVIVVWLESDLGKQASDCSSCT